MRQNTELISQGLKGALEHEFKAPLTILWTVDPSLERAPAARTSRDIEALFRMEEESEGGEETVRFGRLRGRSSDYRDVSWRRGDFVNYPPALQAVVDELGRFPGVGPKSAQRIAFWLMRQPSEDVERLRPLRSGEMKTKLSFCERCCNIAETGGLCPICADTRRDQTTICVVESPPDVVAVERSGAFHGTYHVLHGVLESAGGRHARPAEDPRADCSDFTVR